MLCVMKYEIRIFAIPLATPCNKTLCPLHLHFMHFIYSHEVLFYHIFYVCSRTFMIQKLKTVRKLEKKKIRKIRDIEKETLHSIKNASRI